MSILERSQLYLGSSGARLPLGIDPSERLQRMADAFAEFVDMKSPFTSQHSHGVAHAAVAVARMLELPWEAQALVRQAALLHDIGKLLVPNDILDKPGPLTNEEWQIMREHPVYTRCILEGSGAFAELAFIAAAHHERLDGSGYPDGLTSSQLPIESRIIAVADVYDALSNARPYRGALSWRRVQDIMLQEVEHGLDEDAVIALFQWREEIHYIRSAAVA